MNVPFRESRIPPGAPGFWRAGFAGAYLLPDDRHRILLDQRIGREDRAAVLKRLAHQ